MPVKGEKAPGHKLTENEVKEIYQLVNKGTLSQKEIGNMYGVSRGCVNCIKLQNTWSHITKNIELDDVKSYSIAHFGKNNPASKACSILNIETNELITIDTVKDTAIYLGIPLNKLRWQFVKNNNKVTFDNYIVYKQ